MKTARIVTLVLTVAAVLIISMFIDIMGGIALKFMVETTTEEGKQTYEIMGNCLLISSAFMIGGTAFAWLKNVWIPLIFNVIGSAFYIYTVSALYSIPNNVIAKTITEPLAERHLLTVIVTVLLFAMTVFNFFDENNVKRREAKRRKKNDTENRQLTDSERIL